MSCTHGTHDGRGAIVVGLDARDTWTRTLDWAVDQALVEKRPLTLVHAVDAAEDLWHDTQGRDTRIGVLPAPSAGQLLLDRARARALERAPRLTVDEVLHSGTPRDVLATAAHDAHLLVIGARNHRGPWVRLFGSTTTAISRRPPCAVVVVRPDHPTRVHSGVLVGVDDTRHSQAALRFAFVQASLHRWPLTVMHVAPEILLTERPDERPEERLHLANALSGTPEDFPDVPLRSVVAYGEPAGCLLDAGRSMNLVVVGAHHGRRMSDVLQGSVVAPLVERARCAVAVVPQT
ncbi:MULTISPECIES: universal stress protein [unclassified Nocardioides]|uniref:universal stress protein n=1 Tax=unclassified Nocardioides TaxID=2615069 RepID=UPI00360DF5C5